MGEAAPVILVIGQQGQLGFELMRALSPLGKLVGADRATCDLANADAVKALVLATKPAVIVNAAAYTAVDKAESDRDLAFQVNATAVQALAAAAAELDALLVHYSTDYVFDGTKPGPYVEEDPAAPVNVYGASKHAGETALAQTWAKHLIFRTTWVFGAHGGNFAKTMLKLARDRDTLKVIADQHGAPTSAALIADVTALVVSRYLGGAADFPFGLYHLTAKGHTTWHGYAQRVIAQGAEAGLQLKATPEQVLAIPTSEYPTPAARPANSRLNCDKLERTFNIHLPDWTHHVAGTIKLIAELKQ